VQPEQIIEWPESTVPFVTDITHQWMLKASIDQNSWGEK
jgi:hypothetical protein